MPDLASEMKEKVLAKEQEINNAVAYKMVKNHKTPRWVKIGKLKHAERMRVAGKSWDEQAKSIGVHPTTMYMWRRDLGYETPKQKNMKGYVMRSARKHAIKVAESDPVPILKTKPSKSPDYIPHYTVDEVLDYAGLTFTREERLEIELGLLKHKLQDYQKEA